MESGEKGRDVRRRGAGQKPSRRPRQGRWPGLAHPQLIDRRPFARGEEAGGGVFPAGKGGGRIRTGRSAGSSSFPADGLAARRGEASTWAGFPRVLTVNARHRKGRYGGCSGVQPDRRAGDGIHLQRRAGVEGTGSVPELAPQTGRPDQRDSPERKSRAARLGMPRPASSDSSYKAFRSFGERASKCTDIS